MTKNMLSALMIVGLMGPSLAAKAQAQDLSQGQMNDGVLYLNGSSLSGYQASLDNQIGYRIDSDDLSASFLVSTDVQRAFTAAAHMRPTLPSGQLPTSFLPIIDGITKIIDQTATRTAERNNGLTHKQLATKIVRLSFCFGTDPYGVARQIQQESHFDQIQKSNTGAVGLTQMTSSAIDEVNDQFGNRGIKGANPAVIPYLKMATSCYMGSGKSFASMVGSGAISRGSLATKNLGTRSRAKAYFKNNVDRQLIYGQVTLKVNLARARDKGLSGTSAYIAAMQGYNGDKKHGEYKKYARKIVGGMKKT